MNINKDELKSSSKAIETVHNHCCNENKGATELVAELGTLYQCIRWVAKTQIKTRGKKSQTIITPLIQNQWTLICRWLWLFWCKCALRFPVVAMGVLKWVDWTVSEPRYFQLQTDHTPVHLALLDEVPRGS